MQYARVAVNVPKITGVFDYHLPDDLVGRVGVGCLLTVPFGKQTVQGVVLELVDHPLVAETKSALDLLYPLPALSAVQMELAKRRVFITCSSGSGAKLTSLRRTPKSSQ
jgi:primosomal protein N'